MRYIGGGEQGRYTGGGERINCVSDPGLRPTSPNSSSYPGGRKCSNSMSDLGPRLTSPNSSSAFACPREVITAGQQDFTGTERERVYELPSRSVMGLLRIFQ